VPLESLAQLAEILQCGPCGDEELAIEKPRQR